MLYMMEGLDFKNFDLIYLFTANNDTSSLSKAISFFQQKCLNFELKKIVYKNVPRIYFHTNYLLCFGQIIKALLIAAVKCFLVNCQVGFFNGPGSCLSVMLFLRIQRILKLKKTEIVCFESFCRTSSLSLTVKVAKYVADRLFKKSHSSSQKTKAGG